MRYETSIEIDAPFERVWDVMKDVERWHEWTASIRSVEYLDGGTMQVGSRARVRQPKLPPATWRVSSVDEASEGKRSFTWTAGGPGMRSVGTHSVAARSDGGTVATLSIENTGLLARLFWTLLAGTTRRYVDMEAAGLKARSEAATTA